MAPRRYRIEGRRKAMEETRQRILEATVALHADQGVLATTYAQIAARADVALPTVYKYFPDLPRLVAACTRHVDALAPALGPEIFAPGSALEARIEALVTAVFVLHRFQAPWLRHGPPEAGRLPALDEFLAEGQARLRTLIALALAPRYGEAPPPGLIALFETLLDFSAWQRLTRTLPAQSPEAVTRAALLALVTADMAKSPTRESARQRRRGS
ncbi:MAG TPA: TetR/AcrR family transcriptional regulator [Dongiaceae bacterium]|nr:TetR/AcrR family transcriptional regulator [Dongiaceae bacterium]